MPTPPLDSGLLYAERTLLRRGMIRMLTAQLARASGGFAAAVIGFPHIVKDYADDSAEIGLMLDLLNGAAPAYIVAIGDMKAVATGAAGSSKGDFEAHVYCYSTSMRSIMAGRMEPDARADADSTADPGIETMMVLARMMLTGKRVDELGSKMSDLKFDGEHHIASAREESIWAVRFTATIGLNVDVTRGITDTINSLAAAHFPATYLQPEAPPPTVSTLTIARTNGGGDNT